MKNKFCDSTWVGPSSENLCFLLPDHHLAEHVAGTEEILKGNLVGVPPEELGCIIKQSQEGSSDHSPIVVTKPNQTNGRSQISFENAE